MAKDKTVKKATAVKPKKAPVEEPVESSDSSSDEDASNASAAESGSGAEGSGSDSSAESEASDAAAESSDGDSSSEEEGSDDSADEDDEAQAKPAKKVHGRVCFPTIRTCTSLLSVSHAYAITHILGAPHTIVCFYTNIQHCSPTALHEEGGHCGSKTSSRCS